ncbi:Alcohol dehydrogenase 2 [Ilyonectria robusta]
MAALRQSNTKPGDWMVVSGEGGRVGYLVTQMAPNVFEQRVITIDQAGKGDVKQGGAEVFLDVMEIGQDLPADVKRCLEGLCVHTDIAWAASNIQHAHGADFQRPGDTMIDIGLPRPSVIPEQLIISKQETVKLSQL